MSIDLRVKHDLESRRRAVELFDAGVGCKPAAEALSVPRETVREWQWVYRAFGSEALLSMGGKQSRYTFEQRVAAASAVVDGGMAKTDAMAEFGIRSKSPLERWCRLYREGGAEALRPGPKGRPRGSRSKPRFETPPGLQLQFDWKESVRMANRDGELFEFNVFAATLGHSRRHIFIRSGTRTTDDLVRCMYATIARLGGVPREWVTDNMSALVTVKGGRRLKVQRAYEFAKAAGFELKLCRPRSPQTKGKVESSNRFLSRLAAYQGDFDGWDDIDEIIARIEDASNSEPNETTGLPPSALFMEEKDALLPVGNLRALEEAMGDVVRVARVPATMLVSAHGEPMSVPRRCIGRPARIVCMPGGAMDCYVGGELVATHVAGGPAYDPAHYAEAMAGKRWFGDAAGDIEAAAAANLGLLDSIGGSL